MITHKVKFLRFAILGTVLMANTAAAFNDPLNCIPPVGLAKNASISVLSVTEGIHPQQFDYGTLAAITDTGFKAHLHVISPSDLTTFLVDNKADYTIVLAKDDLQGDVEAGMRYLPEDIGIAILSANHKPRSSSIGMLGDSPSMAMRIGLVSSMARDDFINGYAVGSYVADAMNGIEVPFSSLIVELENLSKSNVPELKWRK